MSYFIESTITANESSDAFLIIGNCDIWVSGLTGGAVQLEVLFPHQTEWLPMPEELYTTSTFKTIFISEDGVRCRLTGVGATGSVYCRLARFLND